ncbi:hypothetical protein [Streptomyces sp. MK37H]|uniref:hypothetical protein n=1 Tax=Streptomyces sp. MK37H TaxID=2699117 RepID=UPI001B3839EA|nr:hypothetical protein [Streptomyces sp. MK37H]
MQLDINAFETFADSWAAIHRKIQSTRTEFHDDVVRPVHSEHWIGEGGKAAQGYCNRILLDVDALDAEVRGLRKYLDETADGAIGRGGASGLEGHRQAVVELQQQVLNAGMTVSDTGEVRWSEVRTPGPLSPSDKQHIAERNSTAAQLEQKIKAELSAVTEIDQQLARDLKVIFGTPDNFETENRKYGITNPGFDDWLTYQKLKAVEAGMRSYEGWPNASALLHHYLEGNGDPYQIDPATMLADIPQFQRDLNGTLDGVRQGADGKFTTPWTTTAPRTSDGGKSLDWFYALNHFQYRTVGEKRDGRITYHIEVQKRYDWGIPSEHRSNVSGAGITLEQADIAHLNTSGMARDFDVHGRSGERTEHG